MHQGTKVAHTDLYKKFGVFVHQHQTAVETVHN